MGVASRLIRKALCKRRIEYAVEVNWRSASSSVLAASLCDRRLKISDVGRHKRPWEVRGMGERTGCSSRTRRLQNIEQRPSDVCVRGEFCVWLMERVRGAAAGLRLHFKR